MEVKIAEICGLCNGCKRAIDTVIKELDNNQKVVIFKEIVHNKNVNKMLINSGAITLDKLEDLDKSQLVVLRGHGEPPEVYDYLKTNGINYNDCTCPNVTNIHNNIEKYSSMGYEIILLGKHKIAMHPEVYGSIGWSKTHCHLIEDEEDIINLTFDKTKKYYIICQTTFNISKAEKYIDMLKEKLKSCEVVVNKSLCSAQKQINQSSAILAQEVDLMIVVGGKNSSNSKELFNNVSTICPSIFIEDIYKFKEELKQVGITLTSQSKIGITAGASTMKEELAILKQLLEENII